MLTISINDDSLPERLPLSVAYTPEIIPTLLHDHDCTEMAMMLSGSAEYIHSDGQKMSLLPGTVIVVHPGQRHNFMAPSCGSMINFLYVPDMLFTIMIELLRFPGLDLFFPPPGKVPIVPIIRLGSKEFQVAKSISKIAIQEQSKVGHMGYECLMSALFQTLLVQVLRSYSNGLEIDVEKYNDRGVEAAMRHIEQHPFEPFHLQKLCSIAAMGHSKFNKYFKTRVGMSPKQYAQRILLREAIALIMKGDLSLSEVAMHCGFCDSSHFSRVFKYVMGETPGNFKSRLKNGTLKITDWDLEQIRNPFVGKMHEEE